MFDVAVAGAGISGLAVAYRLMQRGQRVIVLEGSSRTGGLFRTERIDGYLCELGPHSTLGRPAVLSLVEELGLTASLVTPATASSRRYLWRRNNSGGSLIPFPLSPPAAITSEILSWRGKCRLLKELVVPRSATDDESVADFVRRRFGPEAVPIFAAGLSGIYAADIESLSARSALPRLWDTEQTHGSILRSSFKSSKRAPLVAFAGGMETLTAALAAKIGPERIKLNSPVVSVRPLDDSVEITFGTGIMETICVQKLILTSNAEDTAKLITPLDPELAGAIARIPYAPLGVIEVAYEEKDLPAPLDAFGFLAEPQPGKPLLGAIYCSAIFPGRTPAGSQLLSAFIGGALNPALSDVTRKETAAAALSELEQIIGAKKPGRILAAKHWPKAVPNFRLQHYRLMSRVDDFERNHPRIRFAGNWRSGVSVADCLERSEQVAGEV